MPTRVFENKLSSRALTLIGGGIASAIVTPTTDMVQRLRRGSHSQKRRSPFPGWVSNRKRRKMHPQWTKSKTRIQLTQHDAVAVSHLYDMWKEYFQALIHTIPVSWSTLDSNRISSTLGANLELVGARVRILECKAHSSLIGQEGIIVMDSRNTWRLAMGTSPGNMDDTQPWKLALVPKIGSTLELDVVLPKALCPLVQDTKDERPTKIKMHIHG